MHELRELGIFGELDCVMQQCNKKLSSWEVKVIVINPINARNLIWHKLADINAFTSFVCETTKILDFSMSISASLQCY